MEGSGYGLIYGISRYLPGKTEENHEKPQSAQPVSDCNLKPSEKEEGLLRSVITRRRNKGKCKMRSVITFSSWANLFLFSKCFTSPLETSLMVGRMDGWMDE
jgi:hypothetical protein